MSRYIGVNGVLMYVSLQFQNLHSNMASFHRDGYIFHLKMKCVDGERFIKVYLLLKCSSVLV